MDRAARSMHFAYDLIISRILFTEQKQPPCAIYRSTGYLQRPLLTNITRQVALVDR